MSNKRVEDKLKRLHNDSERQMTAAELRRTHAALDRLQKKEWAKFNGKANGDDKKR